MGNTDMNETKYAVEWARKFGEKVLPRAPLMECSADTKMWIREEMEDLTAYEVKLAGKAR